MSRNAINDYWNSLTARYQAGPLPDFFAWWKGELSALIPSSLRQRMIPPKPVVWLRPDAELQRLEIWPDARADEPRDYYGADEDAGILRNRWHELINDFPDGQPEIRLCLPAHDVLYLPVELPLAVESNLGESLQYQLDQLTPFRPDQVYYDYSIAERNAEHGRLKVDLRMALRPRVDQLLERLASIGIRPHAVDCAISEDQPAGTGKLNLLPAAQRPRPGSPRFASTRCSTTTPLPSATPSTAASRWICAWRCVRASTSCSNVWPALAFGRMRSTAPSAKTSRPAPASSIFCPPRSAPGTSIAGRASTGCWPARWRWCWPLSWSNPWRCTSAPSPACSLRWPTCASRPTRWSSFSRNSKTRCWPPTFLPSAAAVNPSASMSSTN